MDLKGECGVYYNFRSHNNNMKSNYVCNRNKNTKESSNKRNNDNRNNMHWSTSKEKEPERKNQLHILARVNVFLQKYKEHEELYNSF